MSEETDFNTPSYEDVMAARRVNEFNKPWWEKVTPYTGILYVDYVLSHQMTPLFIMFMFTILFRWGYGLGAKWLDGVVQSAGGGARGTKEKVKKKGNDKDENNRIRFGAIGNLSELKYSLMEPSKTIEGFDVRDANVHRQHMLDFATAYPDVLRSYNSPREILSNSDLDALFIALNPVVRFRWIRDALLSKKHVICPSPIACSGDEAIELVRPRRKAFAEWKFDHRHHPAYRRFTASVAQIGPIFRAKAVINVPSWAVWYWPSTDKDFDRSHGSGGGAFRRYGPYCIDVMRTMFDITDSSQVNIVSVTPETSFDKNVDDKMTVEFEITAALSEKYEKYNGLLKEKKRRVIVEVSYATGVWPKANIQASGPRGSLKYYNFMLPQLYN